MTRVIRLALFWHWQPAGKKKGERESYYTDEKEGRQKDRLNRYLYTLVLRIIIENHINLRTLKIRYAKKGSWIMQD